MNHDKTEYTEITRLNGRNKEEWRSTRKLGSLIGDDEDVLRRKQLATAAFRGLWNLWKRGQQVSEKLRLRLYQAFIIPVLLYNSGTWAVTKTARERLDSFHRRQLRSLIASGGLKQYRTTHYTPDVKASRSVTPSRCCDGSYSDMSSVCPTVHQPSRQWSATTPAKYSKNSGKYCTGLSGRLNMCSLSSFLTRSKSSITLVDV